MKLFVINGPNLNLLGVREPDIYGKKTYADLVALRGGRVRAGGRGGGNCFQSNHEGALVDIIQSALGRADGIVINPAGLHAHERGPSSTRSRPSPCPRWRCI